VTKHVSIVRRVDRGGIRLARACAAISSSAASP
jgi:hypothetical protein